MVETLLDSLMLRISHKDSHFFRCSEWDLLSYIYAEHICCIVLSAFQSPELAQLQSVLDLSLTCFTYADFLTTQWLCRNLILPHLSQPWRITKKEKKMNLFVFSLFTSHVLHSEGKLIEKFSVRLVCQLEWRSVKCHSQLLHFLVSKSCSAIIYRGNISLLGFVHVCVSVLAPTSDVRLRMSDETFMQSLCAAETLHFPNEPLLWWRLQCAGGVMATDYPLPT